MADQLNTPADAPQSTGTPTDAAPAARPDPLSSLYRMSTTAGVGSQEYVAVNTLAIAALSLGLASALVLLGSVLLIIPALGIIGGVTAWWQIRHSGGTQTGRLAAGAGIILSLVFASIVGARAWSEHKEHVDGQQQVVAMIARLSAEIQKDESALKWKNAYELFDDTFQQRISQDQFAERWQSLQNTLGAIKGLTWNGTMPVFEDQPVTGQTIAVALVLIDFKHDRPQSRESMVFRRSADGTWKIDNFPILFPQEGQNGAPPGASGPAGH